MIDPIIPTEEAPVIAQPAVVEVPKEKTVEQIQEEIVPEAKETVGLDKFLDLKKDNKELRKSMKDLQDRIDAGSTRVETSASIAAIAAKYPDVDKSFLSEFAAAVKAEARQDSDKEVSDRLKPIEEKARQERIDSAFNTAFDAAMVNMPEFAKVVNKEVIKALTLDRKNASKTFSQIIEEAYGNAVPGKRTIETTVPGGGKEPAPLDFEKARTDGAYFNEVMADPKLKKEYNAEMLKRGV